MGLRIHCLYILQVYKTPKNTLRITLNSVREWSFSSGARKKIEYPFYCHCSQVHSDPKTIYKDLDFFYDNSVDSGIIVTSDKQKAHRARHFWLEIERNSSDFELGSKCIICFSSSG